MRKLLFAATVLGLAVGLPKLINHRRNTRLVNRYKKLLAEAAYEDLNIVQ